MTQEETTAYHEAGHAVMHVVHGILLHYISVVPASRFQVGGTKAMQDPGSFAPDDGSVNMKMVMVSVAGAIGRQRVFIL